MNWIEKLPSQLAENIKRKIAKDFSKVYLTHNLVDTMNVEARANQATLHIPAIRYDFKEWNKNKVVVHHLEWGSYANQVNITGGFSTFHKNYIDYAIEEVIWWEMGIDGTYLHNRKVTDMSIKFHYASEDGTTGDMGNWEFRKKIDKEFNATKKHREEYKKKHRSKRK